MTALLTVSKLTYGCSERHLIFLRPSIDHQKPQLQENARRLFHGDTDGRSDGWGSDYDPSYKSRRQAARHAEADGTAFATVALPSHYSAISAVLHHVKHRLGNEWSLRHVIDWGSGAGSCIWYTKRCSHHHTVLMINQGVSLCLPEEPEYRRF